MTGKAAGNAVRCRMYQCPLSAMSPWTVIFEQRGSYFGDMHDTTYDEGGIFGAPSQSHKYQNDRSIAHITSVALWQAIECTLLRV